MSEVRFEDNTVQVVNAIENAIESFLDEVGGELASQVSRKSRVDTGQLKGSWTYQKVGKDEVKVGSPLENAIWEEFGTGIFALNGNGRKNVPWFYEDEKGGHMTSGKTPNRALHNAMTSYKPKIQRVLESKLRGLGR